MVFMELERRRASKINIPKEKQWGSIKLEGISVKVKDKGLMICKEKVVNWPSR